MENEKGRDGKRRGMEAKGEGREVK